LKIRIDGGDSWELSWSDGSDFDVPDETIARWKAARETWSEVESEMDQLLSTRSEELRQERERQEAIQIEKDRIEVERLRRNALAAKG
jgi:hypothetical protein